MHATAPEIRDVLLIFLRKLSHHEEHDHIHEQAANLLSRLMDGDLDAMCEAIAQEMRVTKPG